jgi:hypothetical protein
MNKGAERNSMNTELTIAQEFELKYKQFPTEAIDALVDEWSTMTTTNSFDEEPLHFFEDGSAITKSDHIALPPSCTFGELNGEGQAHLLRPCRASLQESANDAAFLRSLEIDPQHD